MGKRRIIDFSGSVAYGFEVADASLGRSKKRRMQTALGSWFGLMVWTGKGDNGSLSP